MLPEFRINLDDIQRMAFAWQPNEMRETRAVPLPVPMLCVGTYTAWAACLLVTFTMFVPIYNGGNEETKKNTLSPIFPPTVPDFPGHIYASVTR